MYCEMIEMEDWVDKMPYIEFALNTIWNPQKRETPIYLFYGWDPLMPLEAVIGRNSDKFDSEGSKSTRGWRRKIQRDVQVAQRLVQDATEARWKNQIERYEKKVRGKPFKVGDRVWLYVNRAPEGILKKLAHKWHGPFRIEETRDGGRYYRLQLLPDYSLMHSYVHFDRLKRCYDAYKQPEGSLEDRSLEEFDFDKELLLDDSWQVEENEEGDVFEVEYLIDRKEGPRLRSGRKTRFYLVKWKGYSHEHDTWKLEENLNCGALIYDVDRSIERRARADVLANQEDEAAEVHWGICDTPEWYEEMVMDSVYVCMTYAGRVHSIIPIQADEDTDAREGDVYWKWQTIDRSQKRW